jgi:hypothetical protein
MNTSNNRIALTAILAAGVLAAAGCSGPTEDVRVTFCKDLVRAAHPGAQSLEWQGVDNTFRRPEYAITGLSYVVVGSDGQRKPGKSACHYEYEALDDTAVNLANPFDAYETLPFAVVLEGRALSNQELLAAINAEQKRRGHAVLQAFEQGARDMADKVRAGLAQ